MPDITLCSNKGCFLADRCERAKAAPSPYAQMWSMFEPVLIELPTAAHWHCDYFRPLWAPCPAA
jgi:hypothetical protein